MRATRAKRAWRLGVLGLGLAVVTGCGPGATPRDPTAGEQSIMKLGRAYMAFASSAKDGLGPASAEELKKWLLENDKKLTDLGLTRGDVDGLFTSPRDNQPYQVQPKRHPAPNMSAAGGPPAAKVGRGGPAAKAAGYGLPGILVNEQTGVDGKRLVFLSGTRIQEVDEAEFNKLLSGS